MVQNSIKYPSRPLANGQKALQCPLGHHYSGQDGIMFHLNGQKLMGDLDDALLVTNLWLIIRGTCICMQWCYKAATLNTWFYHHIKLKTACLAKPKLPPLHLKPLNSQFRCISTSATVMLPCLSYWIFTSAISRQLQSAPLLPFLW